MIRYVSEMDEEFIIIVKIMQELLPFDIKLSNNTMTDVKIIDNNSEFC